MRNPAPFNLCSLVLAAPLVLPLAGCHDTSKIPAAMTSLARPDAADVAEAGPACPAGQRLVGSACADAPPSCVGMAATCGPNGSDDCCASDLVPGGHFDLGYDKSESDKQDGVTVVGWQKKGQTSVIVSPYVLDRYEVTVGRFRKFLESYDGWLVNNPEPGAGRHPGIVGSGWDGAWHKNPSLYSQSAASLRGAIMRLCQPSASVAPLLDGAAASNKPMPCIPWHEAMLFCIWDRGRLPTEAEWNFAAAGGEQQNAFPWGPATGAEAAKRARIDTGGSAFDAFDVGTVGAGAGAGRFGQHDLAGNLLEWVADTCRGECTEYTTAGLTNPLENKAPNAIARGGSFKYDAAHARTAYRMRAGRDGESRYIDLGFRCARNAP